jgi:hypothetical protein
VSDRSLVQRSLTECGVSECDREASIMRRPWLIRAVALWGEVFLDNLVNNELERTSNVVFMLVVVM